MAPNIKTSFKGLPLYLSIITVLTLLVYSNVLHGEPQMDDVYVFENAELRSPFTLLDRDIYKSFLSGGRPLTALAFSLNHYMWGRETFSFHLTNLIIHILNGILVFVLVRSTLKLTDGGHSNNPDIIAFFTALLFSIHPVQTESVSYIYQRAESLSSLFYLTSLISFIRGYQAESIGKKIVYQGLFFASFIISLLCKEIAITLPLIAFLYGLYFFRGDRVWRNIALPGALILAGIAITALKLNSIQGNPNVGYQLKEYTAWEYLLTQLNVIVHYLRLIIFPINQNLDYDYPATKTFFEAGTFMSFALLFSMICLAMSLRKRQRSISFFILWFFITLSPSSSIIPLSDACVEHRLYLPSIGIFFISSLAMVRLSGMLKTASSSRHLTLAVCILCVLTFLSAATYHRNLIWKSRLAMWKDVVRKSPKKGRAHNNLASIYSMTGDQKSAIREYLTALTLTPGNTETYYNLGSIFEGFGMLDLARDFYIVFVKYDTNHPQAVVEIKTRYNISEGTQEPDVLSLKKRTIDAYNKLYGKGSKNHNGR